MCMRSKVVHKNIVHIFSLYMYIGKFGNFWGKFCFVLFFSYIFAFNDSIGRQVQDGVRGI